MNLEQATIEKAAEIILHFVQGVDSDPIDVVVEKIAAILAPLHTAGSEDFEKIKQHVYEYRKGTILLEETIQNIYNKALDQGGFGNPLEFGMDFSADSQPNNNPVKYPGGGIIKVNTAINHLAMPIGQPVFPLTSGKTFASFCPPRLTAAQEQAVQKQWVENQTDLFEIISSVIDKAYIHDTSSGPHRAGGFYEVVIKSTTGQMLIHYTDSNENRFMTPHEVVMGFFAEAHRRLSIIAPFLSYDIAIGKITKR